MSKLAVFCSDGVEEIECLTVVDYCKRAGMDVYMISVSGRRTVVGSHHITFVADAIIEEMKEEEFDAIVLPGGPGHKDLEGNQKLIDMVSSFAKQEKLIAAICAAPAILARQGLLKEKQATVYPGLEVEDSATWIEEGVVSAGTIITGRGPAKAGEFALAIIRYLQGTEIANEVATAVVYSSCK